MKTLAAILVETGAPLVIDEIALPELAAGQVMVEILFSGICHTQLLETRGFRGHDPYVPHLLGHEGVGIVEKTGSAVQKVRKGDKVLISWMQGSGASVPGSVYDWRSKRVNSGAVTTFSQFSVISENRLTKIPPDCDERQVSLIGCAGATGFGTVWNTLDARPGNSISVFGCGGIGLCAVQGARLAGCHPIIAVDVVDDKLQTAITMGADVSINANFQDSVASIRAQCPGGVDLAVESSGKTSVMIQSINSIKSKGGVAAIIGNARKDEILNLDPGELNQGKQIRGTWGGDNIPDVHFPKYLRMLSAGRIDLAPLLSREYPLSMINEALDDLENGSVIRPIVNMSSSVK